MFAMVKLLLVIFCLKVFSKGQIPLRYSGRRPRRRPGFPVADRVELSRRVESNLSAIYFRPKKSRELVADSHELVESQVGNQVCDQVCDLDSVMEFGHNGLLSRRANGKLFPDCGPANFGIVKHLLTYLLISHGHDRRPRLLFVIPTVT